MADLHKSLFMMVCGNVYRSLIKNKNLTFVGLPVKIHLSDIVRSPVNDMFVYEGETLTSEWDDEGELKLGRDVDLGKYFHVVVFFWQRKHYGDDACEVSLSCPLTIKGEDVGSVRISLYVSETSASVARTIDLHRYIESGYEGHNQRSREATLEDMAFMLRCLVYGGDRSIENV